MLRIFFLFSALFISYAASSQSTARYVKVHFLYGSKPAKGFGHKEKKRFGGILGGHVSLEIKDRIFGFAPEGSFHVFPKSKERHSYFHNTLLSNWVEDTVQEKYLTIVVPLTGVQYQELLKIKASYLKNPPYDYAFFGYRCAASTYQILSVLGVTEKYKNYRTVKKYFYPRKFRTYLVRKAKEQGYAMYFHPGRSSRKWERDRKPIRKIITERN